MSGGLERRSPLGRVTLVTVTLGSGIALLDGTVVQIALKRMGSDLDASLAQLQWVVNGYLLSLASLILVGGALGDRFGRRRVYLAGVAGFAVASLACAFAPDAGWLIVFRVLQGLAAALLTPGALALIQGTFRAEDRASAIGMWAGVSGIATAIGPFVGGWLIEHWGWRWIFAINVPLCVVVVVLGSLIPESRDPDSSGRFDIPGAVLGVLLLGTATYALTGWRESGVTITVILAVVTVLFAVAFVFVERRTGAMVPLGLFGSRVFSAANLMTFLVYGALGAVMFFLVLQLQTSLGYTPLAAGLASLPVTVAMLLLSSRFAQLSTRTGPRLPMSAGPVVCAVGVFLLAGVAHGTSYWTGVFPGVTLFGLGLAGLVSPLTTSVLAAAPDRHAGIASGINNAVARAGTLLAVAALPAAVGLAGADYERASVLTTGYRHAMVISAILLAAGGLVSWVGLRPSTGTSIRQDPR